MDIRLGDFYETGKRVNEDPLIVVFEDFLKPREVEQLVSAAQSKMKQALVSAAESGVESSGRTGSNCWIPHGYNAIVESLAQRVADVVGLPLQHAESLQVVHYDEGQQYAPHYDAWDAGTERGQRCMARGGQRLITCLMYLNNPQQGGGTSFPNLDMEIRARKGRMVLFHNCQRGSNVRHPDSLHGGMPVLSGEKWACNFWFRERPYQTAPSMSRKSTPTPKFKRVI
ncbi:2OG-Fe(II) oxygenase [Marinobacter sp. chi1]|uniref:2OG-Fe(II) oxygenase n=1 Tax=Marinobacter suaedae TaxID=3057675 RepID=A0ABT8W1L2_9GAMM|nr:2OG-Fe(II) oxygenase [Marinobacter sp. chi1]MDO3722143.1 2OG-Fe(II) oxygenase [Marinobacter sp. chi1]